MKFTECMHLQEVVEKVTYDIEFEELDYEGGMFELIIKHGFHKKDMEQNKD